MNTARAKPRALRPKPPWPRQRQFLSREAAAFLGWGRIPPDPGGVPSTARQRASLAGKGIEDADRLTKAQASWILDRFSERADAGRCSLRQAALLADLGCSEADAAECTAQDAAELLDWYQAEKRARRSGR
jgi:hypothetical protein